MSRLSLARRFWNQVITWALVNPSVNAICFWFLFRKIIEAFRKRNGVGDFQNELPHRDRQVTGTFDRGIFFLIRKSGDW